MDKSAIEQIQVSANIPELINQFNSADRHNPKVLVPENFKVQSLEKFMSQPQRHRFEFNTTDINSFIVYADDNGTSASILLVDADVSTKLAARCIVDCGTELEPMHKEHTATVEMKALAAYKAFLNNADEPMSQKDVSEFIEDWSDHITVFDREGVLMNNAQGAASLRDLTIESARDANSKVGDFGESMTVSERIEAKNQEQIPATIDFECTPFGGFSEQSLTYRVGILTGGSKPMVNLRPIQLETMQEMIAQEFCERMTNELAHTDIKIYMGSF